MNGENIMDKLAVRNEMGRRDFLKKTGTLAIGTGLVGLSACKQEGGKEINQNGNTNADTKQSDIGATQAAAGMSKRKIEIREILQSVCDAFGCSPEERKIHVDDGTRWAMEQEEVYGVKLTGSSILKRQRDAHELEYGKKLIER